MGHVTVLQQKHIKCLSPYMLLVAMMLPLSEIEKPSHSGITVYVYPYICFTKVTREWYMGHACGYSSIVQVLMYT